MNETQHIGGTEHLYIYYHYNTANLCDQWASTNMTIESGSSWRCYEKRYRKDSNAVWKLKKRYGIVNKISAISCIDPGKPTLGDLFYINETGQLRLPRLCLSGMRLTNETPLNCCVTVATRNADLSWPKQALCCSNTPATLLLETWMTHNATQTSAVPKKKPGK